MHWKHEKGAFGHKRVALIDKGGFHLTHHWVWTWDIFGFLKVSEWAILYIYIYLWALTCGVVPWPFWVRPLNDHIRASPTVLSMWLPTVKFIAKKSKCAGLAQEMGLSAPNICSLPWLVKGGTQLCTSHKECNKLDLTAAQYFWLVDYNDLVQVVCY